VLAATIWHGVRARGPLGYLKSFAEPSWVMIPLNVVEQLTRTFSLMVRLFGNVMSGVFVIGIVLSLAGLLVADPADGARPADGRGAGLHLRDAGDGVHRLGGRRRASGERAMMDIPTMSIFGAAIAVSFGAIGPALGEGKAVAAAMEAIARQPEAAGAISRTLFVGLAMIETMAIYCLVVALLLLFANPFAA
jgi:F-type H+-transporting ATPase subunit c